MRSVRYSPDGKYIISGSEDRKIKIWEADTGKELKSLNVFKYLNKFKGHISSVFSVVFSPDGNYIVSGSMDC